MKGEKRMLHAVQHQEIAEALSLLIECQEEEYRSLALEIHDEVGQSLTSVLLRIKVLLAENDPARLQKGLSDLESIVEQSLVDVKRISRVLRPAVLETQGLIAALERLCENSQEHTGIRCRFRHNGGSTYFSHHEELLIYRILQEALTNAYLHGRAKNCCIMVSCIGRDFVLSIKDDGCGFDMDKVKKGIGLLGMTERAAMIGGRMRICSAPQKGTHILLTCRMKMHEGFGNGGGR